MTLVRTGAILAAVAALLAGCASTRSPAPVDDRRPAPAAAKPAAAKPSPPPAAAPAAAGTYVVKRGDTLYSIALEQGMDYRDLAAANGIDDPSKLRVGQVLRLGGGEPKAADPKAPVQVGTARGASPVESRPLESSTPAPAPAASPAPAAGTEAMKSEPKAVRLPYSEQNVALLQRGEAAKPAPAKPEPPKPEAAKPEPAKPEAAKPAAPTETVDGIEFVWPHRGKIIASFSEPRNKGIDISGQVGDAVLAAASGVVIYVGEGIPGLGKLIVVKHEKGFNTVYAHNSAITVKLDQKVVRGQKIAELGQTGVDSPRLHFEIRREGRPLDPVRYLPGP